ncbi:MAG: allophanate hydrolase [Pseudomonadota bacterium]
MLHTLAFTLSDLRTAYAEGARPGDVIREVYRRIEAVGDPALFLHLRDLADVVAEAEALAAKSDKSPLWGMPFVVKDNIDVADLPTTAGCPAFAYTPDRDAFVVARLRHAGALLIGKTNLDQFATGLVGVRSPYGVPRNAIDATLVPGGSSSGSGVAVAHGLVPFSLGTDTAGSGRVPAALNNIVGLKPSLGALSNSGVVPACRTLDTISVFARSVADAYAVFEIACAYDEADAYAVELEAGALAAAPDRVRIGIPASRTRRFFGDDAQADMFDAAIDTLRDKGAAIVELDFTPFYDIAELLYEGAWIAERYTVIEDLLSRQPEAVHPTTAAIVGPAERLSAADAFRGLYRLKDLTRIAERALEGIEALCVPSIPTFYTLADLEADPVTPNSNLGTYTNFVNLLGLCGVAVPTAQRSDGRPGSVTVLARHGADALAASIAALFEAKIDTTGSARTVQRDEADTIELAVCGAHMSGLPLNGQLTSLGATFCRSMRTAERYRLYALAGGPPYRPGLLRTENGARIELEVWALPTSNVGPFMAGIPSPLSIGTVELEDGTRTHGFLVEAAGLDGAEDITDFGGWRGYLTHQDVA